MKRYSEITHKLFVHEDSKMFSSVIRLVDLADEAVEKGSFSDEFERNCWEVAQKFSYSLLDFIW